MENVLLNEERGVAAFKYKEVVDEIYEYAVDKIEDIVKKYGRIPESLDGSPFIIPGEIACKLDFLYVPMIVCEINVHELDSSIEFGSGYFSTNLNGRLINGRLNTGGKCITIDLYCNRDGHVYKKSFYSTIYHEINHAYECYKSLDSPSAINKAKERDFFKGEFGATTTAKDTKQFSTDVSLHINDVENDIMKLFGVYGDDIGKSFARDFKYLGYRIFSDTELRAQIAQVYGSLKAMDSKRENFREDIKQTHAYQIAQNCDEFVEAFKVLSDDLTIAIRDIFQKYGMKISRSNNPEKIRKDFISLLKRRKDMFMRGVGKAASLYYDSVEDKEDIINEYKKNPFFGTRIIEGVYVHYDPPTESVNMQEIVNRLKELNDR